MKRQNNFKKILSLLFCLVLIAAIALCTTACDSNTTNEDYSSTPTTNYASPTVIGEGEKQFSLLVTDKDGKSSAFTVNTDKETVGDALLELKLIEGDIEQHGLYIKSVNGITADYDTDGTYWAFYINGEYASSGVDTTKIKEGAAYTLKVEK